MSVDKQSSLYVGDLAPEATEANLFDVFREVGPVLSIRVCRDAVTRRSLGYAYVNFQNPSDATRALQTLNFTKIKGRACRIMWCQRDPSLRKNAKGNIFIKNLAKDIDNKSLHDTFQAFGTILSCKIVTDGDGVSRGYGFVHFESEEAANEAVKSVNQMLLNDSQVTVCRFQRKDKKIKDLEKTYTNIYVKHFSKETSEEELKKFFGKFGEISSCLVRRDTDDKALGYAFINYKEHAAASKAAEEANGLKDGIVAEGKTLFVGRHQRKDEREHFRRAKARERASQYQKYANLYIKNLDDTVTTTTLRESFADFGSIVSARVMMDASGGASKGFGFVCFRDSDAANKAVQAMNGRIFCGKPLFVALAQRKEQRRAQLELFYRSGKNPYTGGAIQAAPSMSGVPGGPFGGGASRGGGMGFGSRGGGGRGGPRPGASRGGMRSQGMMPMMPMYPQQVMMQQRGPMGGIPMMPQVHAPRGAPSANAAPYAPQGPSGVDPARLAGMNHEQQKNLLGEKLFGRITEMDSDNAAKITGML
eukprot:Hpha_TRINITY_DN15334_c4_g8::TRINITY_DN15334_c4_g8_i1::g.90769::m.90769/K13126/PABPC; polyadenylate-binding protein